MSAWVGVLLAASSSQIKTTTDPPKATADHPEGNSTVGINIMRKRRILSQNGSRGIQTCGNSQQKTHPRLQAKKSMSQKGGSGVQFWGTSQTRITPMTER
ncbi:hypothetical protein GCM10009780_45820 [Actinomadura alba]